MRSTFSQVSPRLEPFFGSSDFLRLSGVSAAARHRPGSTSLLRTDLMRKKVEKRSVLTDKNVEDQPDPTGPIISI